MRSLNACALKDFYVLEQHIHFHASIACTSALICARYKLLQSDHSEQTNTPPLMSVTVPPVVDLEVFSDASTRRVPFIEGAEAND